MNGNRRIDTAGLNNLGGSLLQRSDELRGILNLVSNINDNVTAASVWAGPAATKYADIIAQQVPDMNLLANTIGQCGDYLKKAASYYEQVEQNLADNMGGNY